MIQLGEPRAAHLADLGISEGTRSQTPRSPSFRRAGLLLPQFSLLAEDYSLV